MKRRMYGALVAAGLVSALIAGCGSSNTAATEAAKGGGDGRDCRRRVPGRHGGRR